MSISIARRMVVTSLLMLALALALAGCGDPGADVTVSYTLPFAPVTFSLNSSGHISVSLTGKFVSEIGEFDVTAEGGASPFASSPEQEPKNVLIVIIRHKQDGILVDSAYRVNVEGKGRVSFDGHFSEVTVTWDGTSTTIFVDASRGDITKIVIQGQASETDTAVPTDTPQTVAGSSGGGSGGGLSVSPTFLDGQRDCALGQPEPYHARCSLSLSNRTGHVIYFEVDEQFPPLEVDYTSYLIHPGETQAMMLIIHFEAGRGYCPSSQVFTVTFAGDDGSSAALQVACPLN